MKEDFILTTTILYGFTRKEIIAVIFFAIEKAYDKVNRERCLKLENMGIEGRMMEFIRELTRSGCLV